MQRFTVEQPNRQGFYNTGASAKPIAKEEVDWYCNCMGAFHMEHSLETSASPAQSDDIRSWLMLEDSVLFLQAAQVLGVDALKRLAEEYEEDGAFLKAAKSNFGRSELSGADDNLRRPLLKHTLSLLERSGPRTTRASQQLVRRNQLARTVSPYALPVAAKSVCA